MKAVPKVNTNGLYLEDTLVDDTFSGVVPFYALKRVFSDEIDSTDESEQPKEVEPEIAGYIVGLPVPQSLYHPRFDLSAWEAREEGDVSDQSSFWVEGLTQVEIGELTKLLDPTELERIQTELTNTQVALTETYEQLLVAQEETINTQNALSDVYEQLLTMQEELSKLKGATE